MMGADISRPYRNALVLDDDPTSQALACITLEALGISQVVVMANGREGLQAYDRMASKPDLVVCDLYMPDMDGIEFIQALGNRDFDGALVLCTAGDPTLLEVACQVAIKAHGLDLVGAFPKPLDPVALARALHLPPPPAAAL